MSHCVSGIVTLDKVNERQRLFLGLPILKTEKSSFLAISEDRIEAWSKNLKIEVVYFSEMITDEGPNNIDNSVVIYFTKMLEIENFALVETEYFGGVGMQSATLYKNGIRITQYSSAPDGTGKFEPSQNAINIALYKLGLKPTGSDAFEFVGLNKFRNTLAYYPNTQ